MRITRPAGDDHVDIDKVDLFDPGWYADGDPHPVWHWLRVNAPAHRQTLPDGRRFWSVTRHADACRVLRDHETFTSERGTLLCALDRGDPAGGKMMAATDPPRHALLREPLNHALSARALAQRSEMLRSAVRTALDPARDGGVWDLAAAAARLPMAFTGTLMGLPEQDWPDLIRWTWAAIAPDDPDFGTGDPDTTLATSHHALFGYFRDRIRHRDPARDDLVGTLLGIRLDGRELRLDEAVYNCYSLLLGANVTTPHVISASAAAFVADPDAYRRLVDDPGLVDRTVEEALRWSSPANHFMRYAIRDTTVAGRRISAGEAVAVWLGSANRDASVFVDPYRFDVTRSPNRHIAFGYGPHFCVGAPLARIVLRMVFAEMRRVVTNFELAGPVRHLRSNFVAGITRLPVRTSLAGGDGR
ncbi:cytochrome P450 [Solwaraspora sp. WMMD406]|uniref:cytochrome P450 n=1 Tax=Solwaraspora sp. WMMD406 TaxID=3016095 RepID=UPI002415A437|nr:cytochrome P450 [Solwaraspora sp. WMMD406]MDG4765806.1 cytochrome P450 [Solwaraspora sp. WMMD406]